MAPRVRTLLSTALFLCLMCPCFSSKSLIVPLDEDNWEVMLNGHWMVLFYAPWCPACKNVLPVWEDFSSWSKDLALSVGQVDITTSPALSGRFVVTALPTIYHVIDGEFRQYKGARDIDSLISFIEDERWTSIEAVSWWKSPSSIQMSLVSYFFKLSQYLRMIHNKLMEDYGLPSWGSYLIFALVTIILGALLGLVLVCFIDYIYPPKVVQRTPVSVSLEKEPLIEESDEDLADEELVDEQISETNSNTRKRKPRKAD